MIAAPLVDATAAEGDVKHLSGKPVETAWSVKYVPVTFEKDIIKIQ